MTNSEMDAYRQALIEQEKADIDWHNSRFAGVDEYQPLNSNLDRKINSRINGHHEKSGATRKGSGAGYNSPEAKAKRKGQHDINSGRLTPEAIALMPTPEVYESAWRTRGELSPKESSPEKAARKMGKEMMAGREYSPEAH